VLTTSKIVTTLASTIADEIQRYIRTGDTDPCAWADEGMAARRRVRETGDVRLLVRGLLSYRRAGEEQGRTAHGGRGARARSPHRRRASESEEVSSIVLEAALARNGWKVIHDRCAPSRARAASKEPLRGTESLERGGGSL
jgi:hypothetical protein